MERAGLELESRPAWKEGCHKFTSSRGGMFLSHLWARELWAHQRHGLVCGSANHHQRGCVKMNDPKWPRQTPTVTRSPPCSDCAYANVYRSSHLATFDMSKPFLNYFGCKMVITPKPRWNNKLVSVLSLPEFIAALQRTHSNSNGPLGRDVSSNHTRVIWSKRHWLDVSPADYRLMWPHKHSSQRNMKKHVTK